MDPADRGSGRPDPLRSLNSPDRAAPAWLRWSTFLLALIILVWLPVEDQNPGNSLRAAGLVCLVFGAHLWHRAGADPCRRVWSRYPAGAAAIGASIPLLAALMMAFKSGLHSHGFPDYFFRDYLDVLQTIPYLILAGFLTGLAASAWRWRGCRPGAKDRYGPEPGK